MKISCFFANALRTGRVSVNGAPTDSYAPMGGYKQSGIVRSMCRYGLDEYLELKSVYGFEDEIGSLPEWTPELSTPNQEK